MVPTGQNELQRLHFGHTWETSGEASLHCRFCTHTMAWQCSKKIKQSQTKNRRGVIQVRGWGVWPCELRLHHVTSQIYSSTAASTKQRGAQRLAPAVKLAQWRQHGGRYLGRHSQPSNTALWGTQQTGLAFPAHADALLDNWLCLPMQSNRRNTTDSTVVSGGAGGSGFTALSSSVHHFHFMNVNVLFTKEVSLAQRVISSLSMWPQLIISQTDVWEMVIE